MGAAVVIPAPPLLRSPFWLVVGLKRPARAKEPRSPFSARRNTGRLASQSPAGRAHPRRGVVVDVTTLATPNRGSFARGRRCFAAPTHNAPQICGDIQLGHRVDPDSGGDGSGAEHSQERGDGRGGREMWLCGFLCPATKTFKLEMLAALSLARGAAHMGMGQRRLLRILAADPVDAACAQVRTGTFHLPCAGIFHPKKFFFLARAHRASPRPARTPLTNRMCPLHCGIVEGVWTEALAPPHGCQ
jgi:hypothetical protein